MIPFKDYLLLHEAVYAGNIGIMELTKFYQKATAEQIATLKRLIVNKKTKEAWDLVQDVLDVKLHASVHEQSSVVDMHQVSVQGVQEFIGKKRFNSMITHKFFLRYRGMAEVQAWKVAKNEFDRYTVEWYPISSYSTPKTPDGKWFPTVLVSFDFVNEKVTNAHVYTRAEGSKDWVHLKSYLN